MTRKPRLNRRGGIYHVFARGNDRAAIFGHDKARQRYLQLLAKVVGSRRWRCMSYCLMPNHMHLIIETPAADLSGGMQQLQGGFAQWFNTQHGRCGHVFQGRYGAVSVETHRQLRATASYVALNPVKAGLSPKPEDWGWGSYRWLATTYAPTWLDHGRLLSFFGADPAAARAEFSEMIASPDWDDADLFGYLKGLTLS